MDHLSKLLELIVDQTEMIKISENAESVELKEVMAEQGASVKGDICWKMAVAKNCC